MMISRNKLVILFCALGGHAVNLIPFSYGMFLPYVFSYLYEFDADVKLAMMHVHAPLCLSVATGTAWTFGIFQNYVHERILHVLNSLSLCLWMLVLHFFGSSYTVITIAIAFVGFHAGQMHVYFSQRVTEEGRNHPSTANGFYGFLFGLAGVWGNIMSLFFINPWDVEPRPTSCNGTVGNTYTFSDERVLSRVPWNWCVLAGVMFVLLFPGFFFIAKEPCEEEERKRLLGDKRKDSVSSSENEQDTELKVIEYKEGVLSRTGFTLFITTIGIGTSSMSAFDLFKDYGLQKINDDAFLNGAGLLIPVVGAVGRIAWGALGDKISLKFLFASGNILTFFLQGLMYPARGNKFVYVIVTATLAIMPGMMTLLPPSVKKFMGNDNIALKYGLILTGEVFGCMFYLALTSFLRGYLSDLSLVLLLGLPSALAFVPSLLFIKNIPKPS